jgi:hypothetical protein
MSDYRILEAILNELRALRRELRRHPVVSTFTYKEKHMQSFAPGTTPPPQITITPNNPLDPAQPVPVNTSSDPANYPIATDSTGLIVTVNTVSQTQAGFTIGTTYTNADGVTATGTSQVFGALGAGPADVTSFTYQQTQ